MSRSEQSYAELRDTKQPVNRILGRKVGVRQTFTQHISVVCQSRTTEPVTGLKTPRSSLKAAPSCQCTEQTNTRRKGGRGGKRRNVNVQPNSPCISKAVATVL